MLLFYHTCAVAYEHCIEFVSCKKHLNYSTYVDKIKLVVKYNIPNIFNYNLKMNYQIEIILVRIFFRQLNIKSLSTRVIPKVSSLDILDNNIFHDLYISETCILYRLI